jgi:hypothetical protein
MENITGNPVTNKNYLQTRLFLVDDLRDFVRKTSVIIEAPRRFGKTSVIKEFIRQEENKEDREQEFHILFLELEGEETIDAFCFKLFKELLTLYQCRKRLEGIRRFFGDNWNMIASRLSKVKVSELEIELHEKTREMDFPQWKEKLRSMIIGLNAFDKRTVIVFDEFPDMLLNFKNKNEKVQGFKDAADKLTGWLRSLRQEANDDGGKYQFVFCGSVNLRKTLEDIGISKRINDLEPLVVPPMNSEDATVLVNSLSDEYALEIEQDGIQFMVSKITEGSPYYGQIFIKALRDARGRDTKGKMFHLDTVQAVYDAMLRGGNHDIQHFHSRLNAYLSPIERECSEIILKHLCCGCLPEKQLFDSYVYERCCYELFQSMVNRLIYEGYITRDTDSQGEIKFVSTLLKDWWACKMGVR